LFPKGWIIKKSEQEYCYSNDAHTVTEIVKMVNIHANNVRKWILGFNRVGVQVVLHKNTEKTPRKVFEKETKDKICSVALDKPRELGMKFTSWSLSSLQQYLVDRNAVEKISIEKLRQILAERAITFKKSKEWLDSTNIEYQTKKDVLSLYNNQPKNGIVLCFDEKGTITAKDYQGSAWTENRFKVKIHYKIKGKTEMFATYNPVSQEVVLIFEEKKRQKKL
jgi:transposase